MGLSTRLARREVQKRRGRTLLVSILVALPLTSILLVSTWIKTTTPSQGQYFKRTYGSADAVFRGYSNLTASDQKIAREVLTKKFGTGVAIEEFIEWRRAFLVKSSKVEDVNKGIFVRLEVQKSENHIRDGLRALIGGHWANTSSEVVLSKTLANKWKTSIGDQIEFLKPDLAITVVGIAQTLASLNDSVMFVSDDSVLRLKSTDDEFLLINAVGDVDVQQIANLRNDFSHLPEGDPLRILLDSGVTAKSFPLSSTVPSIWIGVFTILAFAVMSVIVGAAFATSARRLLTTVGQLSANGAPHLLIQRSLALQGAWSGMCGVILSLLISLLVISTGREYFEGLAGYVFDHIRLPISEGIFAISIALVASTLAAWLPSRMAARTSVLDALAGRRGEKPPPRSLFPIGLILFSAGVGLELLVAVGLKNSDGSAGSVFVVAGCIGGLLILAGVCCLGPVVVSIFGWLGIRSRGVTRLMARGLFRNRSRSAAVVVSITAFTALGIAVAMGAAADAPVNENEWFPNNMVMMSSLDCPKDWSGVSINCSPVRTDKSFENGVREILGGNEAIQGVPLSFAQARDVDENFYQQDASGLNGELHSQAIFVANDFLLNLLKLSERDRAMLEKTGISIVYDEEARKLSGGVDSGSTSVLGDVGSEGARKTSLVVPYLSGVESYPVSLLQDDAHFFGRFRLLITEKRAKEIGFQVFKNSGLILVSNKKITDSQRIQMSFLRQISFEEEMAAHNDDLPEEALMYQPGVELTYAYEQRQISESSLSALVAVVLLVLILLIVGIGLSLMSAEGKDERDVLLAVGAAPSTLSRLAGSRAMWLSSMGLALSIPIGVIPMAVVIKASSQGTESPIHIPWALFGMMLIVPVVAYVVARIASAIVQFAKPVHISNAQFE